MNQRTAEDSESISNGEGQMAPVDTSPVADDRGPNPLWQLVLSRIREFYREPEALFWVYGFPLLMALALGIAFRNQPAETILVDIVSSPVAEKLEAALSSPITTASEGSEEFAVGPQYKVRISSEDDARVRLRTGKTSLVIATQADAPDEAPLSELKLDYWLDPTRPEGRTARAAVDDLLQRAAGRSDPVVVSNVEYVEPGGRYIDFLIPGLIGLSLLSGGLFGIGFVTVDMRVRHLLKRFITTPMKRSHFLGALMLSRFIFNVTEVGLLLVFANYVFDVRVEGNLITTIVIIALGALMFAGLGLLVASRAKTLETVSGLMNLTMMPMWILSGTFFSYERFPEVAHPFIKLLPLTPLNDSLRAVMNEGASVVAVAPELSVMAVWTIITFLLALRLFRWY